MMSAIGTDEKISEILSALLVYREPDTEDVRCAIDAILELIKEEREACAKIADEELSDLRAFRDHCRSKGMLEGEASSFAKIAVLTRIAERIRARASP